MVCSWNDSLSECVVSLCWTNVNEAISSHAAISSLTPTCHGIVTPRMYIGYICVIYVLYMCYIYIHVLRDKKARIHGGGG